MRLLFIYNCSRYAHTLFYTTGPLFRVPVTVIIPERPADPCTLGWPALTFKPGDVLRRFVAVPDGATWAEISVRAGALDTPRMFVLHALQVRLLAL